MTSGATINFGNIDTCLLFGGSDLLLRAVEVLTGQGINVAVFSCARHLDEPCGRGTLRSELQQSGLPWYASDDINHEPNVRQYLGDRTMGLSLGAAWIFKKAFIESFNGRLLNMHGTQLPKNRGGGGFSWQIMMQNRMGACLLHQVDGGIDTGPLVKVQDFTYSPACKIPRHFQTEYFERSLAFLKEFVAELRTGKDFRLLAQPEYLSTYWPRLNTEKQGFINWSWSVKDIERFIDAFDEPYTGASTFMDGRRFFLKGSAADFNDGCFHPFQAGLVFRKTPETLSIATSSGTLLISKVLDEYGNDMLSSVPVGARFYTPQKCLEDALAFRPVYTPKGLKETNRT